METLKYNLVKNMKSEVQQRMHMWSLSQPLCMAVKDIKGTISAKKLTQMMFLR